MFDAVDTSDLGMADDPLDTSADASALSGGMSLDSALADADSQLDMSAGPMPVAMMDTDPTMDDDPMTDPDAEGDPMSDPSVDPSLEDPDF